MAKKARKTAKSLTKAAKKGLSKPTKKVQLGTTKREQLEFMLKLTLRSAEKGGSLGRQMEDQANRIRAEIAALKD